MLREPCRSEKVVLTGNLVSPVARSLGCCVFSALSWNSGRLLTYESQVWRGNHTFSQVLKKLLVANTQLLCAFIVFVVT